MIQHIGFLFLEVLVHFVQLAHLGRVSVDVEVGDEDVDEGDEEARQGDDQRVEQLPRDLKQGEEPYMTCGDPFLV